jgi:hypothetical protein
MAVDLAQIIPPLVRAKVEFILIGGMAAIFAWRAEGGPAPSHALTLNMETACPQAALRSEVILFTSVLVAFSKTIPHALSTARVGIQIKRNIQIGTSRMRSPSQMTYGW